MDKMTIFLHLLITIICIAVAIISPDITGKILFIIGAILFGGIGIEEIINNRK